MTYAAKRSRESRSKKPQLSVLSNETPRLPLKLAPNVQAILVQTTIKDPTLPQRCRASAEKNRL